MREISWQRSEGPSELRASPVPAGVLAGAVQAHSPSAERAESLPSFRGHSAPRACRAALSVSLLQEWPGRGSGLSTWTAALREVSICPQAQRSQRTVWRKGGAPGAGRGRQRPTESMALGEVRGGTEPAGCVAGEGESELTSPRARRSHEVLCHRAADT